MDSSVNYCQTLATFGKNVYIGENCSIGVLPFNFKDGCRSYAMGIVVVGDDVFIDNNITIQRGVERDTVIGDNVKIDSQCHIGHDCIIGEGTIITAGCILAGFVEIGKNCRLNPGCNIMNRVKIGDGAVIGMGAVVMNDVPAGETWVGVPARKTR